MRVFTNMDVVPLMETRDGYDEVYFFYGDDFQRSKEIDDAIRETVKEKFDKDLSDVNYYFSVTVGYPEVEARPFDLQFVSSMDIIVIGALDKLTIHIKRSSKLHKLLLEQNKDSVFKTFLLNVCGAYNYMQETPLRAFLESPAGVDIIENISKGMKERQESLVVTKQRIIEEKTAEIKKLVAKNDAKNAEMDAKNAQIKWFKDENKRLKDRSHTPAVPLPPVAPTLSAEDRDRLEREWEATKRDKFRRECDEEWTANRREAIRKEVIAKLKKDAEADSSKSASNTPSSNKKRKH